LNEQYGYTFAQRLCISLKENTSEALFKLLLASFLFSICVNWKTMAKTYQEFDKRGLTMPENLLNMDFNMILFVLDSAGYYREDKIAADMLPDIARAVLERYNGDLRNLRMRAEQMPAKERRLLEEFKGIDDISADFFFQELQLIWDELYPTAGELALIGARHLGFTPDAKVLTQLVSKTEYPKLIVSLMQMEQDRTAEQVLKEALKLEEFVEIEL